MFIKWTVRAVCQMTNSNTTLAKSSRAYASGSPASVKRRCRISKEKSKKELNLKNEVKYSKEMTLVCVSSRREISGNQKSTMHKKSGTLWG